MKSAAAGLFFSLSLPHSFAPIFFRPNASAALPQRRQRASERVSGDAVVVRGANEALGFLSTSLPIIVWRRRG